MDTIEFKPFKDESMVIPITARGLVDLIFGELTARTQPVGHFGEKGTWYRLELTYTEWGEIQKRYRELVKQAKP